MNLQEFIRSPVMATRSVEGLALEYVNKLLSVMRLNVKSYIHYFNMEA